MPDSFDDFCSLWPGADPEGRIRGKQAYPLHRAFSKILVISIIQFFIISNLFHSNKLYDLAYARITENERTKWIIFSKALTIKVIKLKQN